MTSPLLTKVALYVTQVLTDDLAEHHYYHDLFHTQEVVANCEHIMSHIDLTEEQQEQLLVAAWFHDTGYLKVYHQNEAEGAKIAEDFLLKEGCDETYITAVKACIMATQMPQNPTTLLGCILADADLFHLSNENFIERSERLRNEWKYLEGIESSDYEWLMQSLSFLKVHQYHSPYGKEVLQSKLMEMRALVKHELDLIEKK